MQTQIIANSTRRKWKIKHMAEDMRRRLEPMPSPGILSIQLDSFPFNKGWFLNEGARRGRVYSVRTMGDILHIFRLK